MNGFRTNIHKQLKSKNEITGKLYEGIFRNNLPVNAGARYGITDTSYLVEIYDHLEKAFDNGEIQYKKGSDEDKLMEDIFNFVMKSNNVPEHWRIDV